MKLVNQGGQISWSHSNELVNSYIEPFRKLKVDMAGKPFILVANMDKKPIAAFTDGRLELGKFSQKLGKSQKIAKALAHYKKETDQAEALAEKFDFNSALRKISYAVAKSKKEVPEISSTRNDLLNIKSTKLIYDDEEYKNWDTKITDIFNKKLDEASLLINSGKKREAALLLKKLYKAPKDQFSRHKEIKPLYQKCK